MQIELLIERSGDVFSPPVEGAITWTTERKGAPSILTFNVLKKATKSFLEGDPVRLKVDGKEVFFGFVFKKKRDREGIISVTCYDQLRYLKNKETGIYENVTASELVKMLADDFKLNCGSLADTGWKIESLVESNKSLFDIIGDALDETTRNTGKLFVLYDDFGKLTLKNIADLKPSVLINADTGENFSYESSIDDATYNQIKLTYKNEETGKLDVYIAKSGANINNWGVLQYTEEVNNPNGAQSKANSLLKLYNTKTRSLSIENAFGDVGVRAGVLVPVMLALGDINVGSYLLVEKAKHTFKNGEHFMSLNVRGGEFV